MIVNINGILLSRLKAGLPLLTLLVALTGAAAPGAAYPKARRDDALDDYNGVKVADPYRWLERLDSAETRLWVQAEARLTGSYLAGIPVRQSIEQRLTALLDFEKFGLPFHKGHHYFYTHNTGLQQQSVLFASLGLDGTPAIAFDPNALSTNGTLAIVGYLASPDGGTLAYGVSQGGSDWTDWHLRDLASGKDLPDVLRWTKYYHPIFSTDGRGLYYSAFPSPVPGQELRERDLRDAVYYHVLGTPADADHKLYERPDHADWQFEPHLTGDGRWLVLRVGEGEVGDKGLENLYVIDLQAPNVAIKPLAEGFDANYIYAGADHGLLYFETTVAAPRGRVVAIDPSATGRSDWKEVVPQGSDTMDVDAGSVTLVNHQLIVRTLHEELGAIQYLLMRQRSRDDLEMMGWMAAYGAKSSCLAAAPPEDLAANPMTWKRSTPTRIWSRR